MDKNFGLEASSIYAEIMHTGNKMGKVISVWDLSVYVPVISRCYTSVTCKYLQLSGYGRYMYMWFLLHYAQTQAHKLLVLKSVLDQNVLNLFVIWLWVTSKAPTVY